MIRQNVKQQKRILFNILNKLPREELLNLYYNQLGSNIIVNTTAKKKFIIEKLINSVDIDILIKNVRLNEYMFDIIAEYYGNFSKVLNNFNYNELIDIYSSYNDGNIGELTKEDIISNILYLYGVDKLLKHKLYIEKTTPTNLSKTQISSMYNNIKNINDNLKNFNKIYSNININLENTINRMMISEYNKIHKDTSSIIEILNYKIDINNIINEIMLYNVNKNPNDNKLNYESLDKKLNKTNDKEFTKIMGLLKIMAYDYLIKNSNYAYNIDNSLFMEIIKKEFNKVKLIDNRAEIPKLRISVCKRLNIEASEFDYLIEEEWRKGNLRLDIGSPIGEENVEFLTTKDGTKYFYISFRV